jgi:hypothetical protein
MSIEDAAVAALEFWTFDNAITAVAIAGAESGWVNECPSSSDVFGMPGEKPWWRPYSYLGVYSWGLWQIFMPMHYELLIAVTGSGRPMDWVRYLCYPHNNAYIAHLLWQESGWHPWSTWLNGAYAAYMTQALEAVSEAAKPPPPWPPPPPPPAGAPPRTPVEPPWAPVEPPAAVQPP